MTEEESHNQQKAIKHWCENAIRDRNTARSLLKLRHYDWSLFIFHLAIEKLLKALIITSGNTPPFSHDLERLAQLADSRPTEIQKEQLREITKYNIEARYPEVKLSLYHKATPEYTAKWHHICEQIFIWLEKTLSQKSRL